MDGEQISDVCHENVMLKTENDKYVCFNFIITPIQLLILRFPCFTMNWMSRFLYSYLKLLRERKVYYGLIIYCVTDWPVMYIWWFMLVPNNMTRKVLNINQNLSFTQTSCAYQGLAADYWYTVSQNSGPYLLSSFGVYEWYGKRYSVFVYWSH